MDKEGETDMTKLTTTILVAMALGCGGDDGGSDGPPPPPPGPSFCEKVCTTFDCLYGPDADCVRECDSSTNQCTHELFTGRALDQAELCGAERSCNEVFRCINDDGGMPMSDESERFAIRCHMYLTECGVSEADADTICYQDLYQMVAYMQPALYADASECLLTEFDCGDEPWKACLGLIEEPASCR